MKRHNKCGDAEKRDGRDSRYAKNLNIKFEGEHLMEIPSVTFDSNVWENIVDESKRNEVPKYEKLYELIKNKLLSPFFFEGMATMECIPKKERKNFISNYNANISFKIEGEEQHIINGTKHPGLTDYLKENLPKALKLGFKFIKFPRIGAVGLDIESKYFAEDTKFTLNERINRTFECSKFIENLGSGKSKLHNRLDGDSNKGIVIQSKNDNSLGESQFAKDFGEWVDGDALAAHYGYGIDYFCTNDQGKGAGKSSIFSSKNLHRLKSQYGIKVVTPDELLSLLESLD